MHSEMLSVKWRQFYLGSNVLKLSMWEGKAMPLLDLKLAALFAKNAQQHTRSREGNRHCHCHASAKTHLIESNLSQ